jgi:hypothetical protein
MTFAEIEKLLGANLPKSHRYRAWWSNNAFNSVMTKAWLDAGFRTERVDMRKHRLVFRRIKAGSDGSVERRTPELQPKSGSRRHPLFGYLKGTIRIMPGTDLTQPSDPAWGNDA